MGSEMCIRDSVSPGPKPELAPSAPSVPGMVHLGCSGHGGGTRARSDRASGSVLPSLDNLTFAGFAALAAAQSPGALQDFFLCKQVLSEDATQLAS